MLKMKIARFRVEADGDLKIPPKDVFRHQPNI